MVDKKTKKLIDQKKNGRFSYVTDFLHKIFGGLDFSWKATVGLAIICGVYTALMALFVRDGSSFHDIAVTPEWWVLPAVLIIVNCKKPLEAALKVFVFFLISQPLVYLIQVPFSDMGWRLFGYYPYWFKITLLTFPAGYICWYMKKDEWYSGLIFSVISSYLIFTAWGFIRGFNDTYPYHLITTIYCIGIIPIFIIGIFKKKQPRIIATIVAIIVAIAIGFITATPEKFETYRNTYDSDDGSLVEFEFGNEPYIDFWSSEGGRGDVEIIETEDNRYTLKLTGEKNNKKYHFSITDEAGKEYHFYYYYDKQIDAVVLALEE